MLLRPLAILIPVSLLALLAATEARAQCNAPPIPAPGATATWTLARSPYDACTDLTIPLGSTVVMEPGVTLDVHYPATLTVAGTLEAAGTAARPVTLSSDNYPAAVVVTGTLEVSHATVHAQLRPDSGSTVVVTDSTFGDRGAIYAPDRSYPWSSPFVRVERCRFEGPGATLAVYHSFLVVRDTQLTGNGFRTGYSYPWFDGLVVDDAPQAGITVEHDAQPMFLDGLTVRGSVGPGLEIGGLRSGNDTFLGPRNVLEGNAWPVKLGDGGLVPGSVVPSAGNRNDLVLIDPRIDPRGGWTLPVVGTDYAVQQFNIRLGSTITILPGVTVRFGDGVSLGTDYGRFRARGTEDDPVVFTRLDPARPWRGVFSAGGDAKLEHVVLEGSDNGVSAAGAPFHVESSVLRDNQWGAQASGYNPIHVRGTRFENNAIGALEAAGFLDLDGLTNPNSFTGNGVAIEASATGTAIGNWWGAASGPRSPDNPGGTGDPNPSAVPDRPFLTSAPDFTDSAPRVDLRKADPVAEPGSRQVLTWEAVDDGSIVSQRVVLAVDGEYAFDRVIAADLPGDQRSLPWTVPEVGALGGCEPSYLRVIATDDTGKEGWDQAVLTIRSGDADFPGTIRITSQPTGTVRPGDTVDACYELSGFNAALGGVEAFLLLDGDRRWISLGGTNGSGCLAGGFEVPYVSTDGARLAVRAHGGCNRLVWAFGDCFAIRPDPRIPDAPPQITVTSPTAGASFAAGSAIPVRWTASDDEGLRSFDVLASYDAGDTWHELAVNLPPDATGFDWTPPPGETFPDARVKVIVRDVRFQDSSNCATPLVIAGDCATDADGDGVDACSDCADADATSWALPGEDRMLLATSKTSFAWTAPAAPGGTRLVHDALRSRVPSDFGQGTCLLSRSSTLAVIDAELPGLGSPFFYLVRARNGCASGAPGSLGADSFGRPRPEGVACP